MNKIKCLSPEQASKIAAGEVVDRPAHVVKELLENALDAGATAITLYLEKAGKRLIRVVDNGCGMSVDDANLCFAHHATSKITQVNDLASLTTFGFRGEALASIAAVSTVRLLTKQVQDASGVCIVRSGIDTLSVTETTCNTGTDISVEDLFADIPVRRKFLRTDETEWSHIQQLFYAMALSQRQVHFKIYLDSKLRYNCPPAATIRVRLEQLWGYELYTLHDLHTAREGISIEGAITDTHHLRYDRSHMYLFVNNRWIKNPSLLRAWLQGYQNCIPAGKYPAGVLHIHLDPEVIDVNIHPRKEEIQLLHPRMVEQAITQSVKQALEQHMQETIQAAATNYVPSRAVPSDGPIATDLPLKPFNLTERAYTSSLESAVAQTWQAPTIPVFDTQQPDKQISAHTLMDMPLYQIVGQFDKTYILLETEDGLLMVDQHAAHERIVYQSFKTRFESVASVPLMFPPTIQLMESDLHKLEPYLMFFAQEGIELRLLGQGQLSVVACPVICKEIDWHDLIKQMIGWIAEYGQLSVQEMHDTLLSQLRAHMACKAAIKAGDILTQEQMQQLIKDLYHCEDHLTCPHGRPTAWLLSDFEIKKKFKRDYKN